MENIVATYLVIDQKNDNTRVANVRGKTSSKRFQNVYWKCVLSQYISLVNTNPNIKMMFFTNENISPIVEGINIFDELIKIGVQVIYLEFKSKMPNGWYNSWTNQFYMFDIIEYIQKNLSKECNILLLDSDCIITDDISKIFIDINKYGIISYAMDYKNDYIVNGASVNHMVLFYNEIFNDDIKSMKFVGGEFIGFNNKKGKVDEFLNNYYYIRKKAIEAFEINKIRPITEEHFFSLILKKVNVFIEHKYIKRISLFKNFNNYSKDDILYPIWHLPSEKTRGFNIMFAKYKNNKSRIFNKKILNQIFLKQSIYKDLIQFKEKIILTIMDNI